MLTYEKFVENYDIIETLDLDKTQGENRGRELQELLGPNTFNQRETDFFRAYMPYCAKLLIQECEGMGLSIKLRSESSKQSKQDKKGLWHTVMHIHVYVYTCVCMYTQGYFGQSCANPGKTRETNKREKN